MIVIPKNTPKPAKGKTETKKISDDEILLALSKIRAKNTPKGKITPKPLTDAEIEEQLTTLLRR